MTPTQRLRAKLFKTQYALLRATDCHGPKILRAWVATGKYYCTYEGSTYPLDPDQCDVGYSTYDSRSGVTSLSWTPLTGQLSSWQLLMKSIPGKTENFHGGTSA